MTAKEVIKMPWKDKTVEELRKEFKEDLRRTDLSLEDRAYKFIFVNRTSFNGCLLYTSPSPRDA